MRQWIDYWMIESMNERLAELHTHCYNTVTVQCSQTHDIWYILLVWFITMTMSKYCVSVVWYYQSQADTDSNYSYKHHAYKR